MAKSIAERNAKIHSESIADFDKVQSAQYEERMQSLQDRRFYSIAGAQWEGDWGLQFENKPKLEINKIHLSVIRVINEYRNNRVTVDFVPVDGSPSDDFADVCDDMYRACEQKSVADEAYDNAFEEAVGGGMGAFRLTTKYDDDEDPDNEEQNICIEPITDADSCVFFDLDAKRQDKSDAKQCWVLTPMTIDAYIDEWNDDPASWPKSIEQVQFDWYRPNLVYVAEYFKVEEKRETIVIFEGIQGDERKVMLADIEDTENDIARVLDATGYKEVRRRKLKKKYVHKWIMSGGGILEDCGIIAGKYIPIVPVYGKRWFVDGLERWMGHVRLAKDAQRLMNMQRSKLAELSATSSLEKPIFTPEQMAGHQDMWENSNIRDYPYYLLNPMTDQNGQQIPAGPIAYTKSPDMPPVMAALLQITEQDLQDLLGNQQAGEQLQPNLSGKAIELIQTRLDMQSFIYMSNFSKAIKRAGEIWLSMSKDIMVEEGRKVKGIARGGEPRPIELNKPMLDKKTGAAVIENDFSNASYDVVPQVGPSSDSRRAATVRALTGMMQITQDPDTLQVLSSMAMMNMEGEGISEVRSFFRQKLLRMGAIKPTDEEAQQLQAEAQNQQPDAQQEYLQAAAAQADAEGKRANADTVLKIKQAEKAEADTANAYANAAKTASDIDAQHQQQALEVIDRFTGNAQQEPQEVQPPAQA